MMKTCNKLNILRGLSAGACQQEGITGRGCHGASQQLLTKLDAGCGELEKLTNKPRLLVNSQLVEDICPPSTHCPALQHRNYPIALNWLNVFHLIQLIIHYNHNKS